ncbi:MAG: patatin-like phospholipase family protein [Chloracidobacterium sp.]|uniref:Patatin-like phospholipase family protein n=1 Tax=Chloracidobacterium validum TaxID=2821543 RepID=A0ABX8B5A7_9BACT|nr:patatin-like phospholipase family protein [Chloracidobacterium validum]QUW02156.1 patatin-like phospholipase family protein [Chloracidobacterium validum]
MTTLCRDVPVSLVLAAGGARGVAHVGVLEALVANGFQVSEIVGSSAGALIAAYYAGVGLSLDELRRLGLGLTSRHLLAWAAARRAPRWLAGYFRQRAGIVPDYLERLERASGKRLHHGVERIGFLAFDRISRGDVLLHSHLPDFPLADAMRGAVAIPLVYPPRPVVCAGRRMLLHDAGGRNRIPIEYLFTEPFAPRQIVVSDIANRLVHRQENAAKIKALQARHPDVAIHHVMPDALGRGMLLYQPSDLEALVVSGRTVMTALIQSSARSPVG